MMKTIRVLEFKARLETGPKPTVVDVRTPEEYRSESLDGSICLPLQDLHAQSLTEALANCGSRRDEPVYLLCGSGMRATKAAEQLAGSVDHPLIVIEQGINGLKQIGVVVNPGFDKPAHRPLDHANAPE